MIGKTIKIKIKQKKLLYWPTVYIGSSIGWPPIQPRSKEFATKKLKNNAQGKLKFEFKIKRLEDKFSKTGSTAKPTIENNITITPPSLSGTDLKRA